MASKEVHKNNEERQCSQRSQGELSLFRLKLLEWFDAHGRILPWRGIDDPYKIWVSEIILQQTQVAQGWDYYHRFITAYPDVRSLAKAKEEEVLLLWQGLGYYSRALNMLTAARQIMDAYGGEFPREEREVASLKGVGPYTTAAIMSIAYNTPLAVVDGNVYRVLSRVEACETPIDTTPGQKYYRALAQEFLDPERAGKYNQAMMDLGATICTPYNPDCAQCPVAKLCHSKEKPELLQLLPIKAKKTAVENRYIDYFLLLDGDKMWVERRDKKTIWKGLYQFPMHEQKKEFLTEKQLHKQYGGEWKLVETIDLPAHRLTHRLLHIKVHTYQWQGELPPSLLAPLEQVEISEHHLYAFPKPLRAFLNKHFK